MLNMPQQQHQQQTPFRSEAKKQHSKQKKASNKILT